MTPDTTTPPVGEAPIVYLHIGSPKSGTTFLQEVMWHNKPILAKQDILLPGKGPADHERAARDLLGFAHDPTDPTPPWAGSWDALADEVRSRRPRTAVISHETLAAADEVQIERAVKSLDDTEVHVVYTMRDLVSLLPSEWQEYVKHRCVYDFETWLTKVLDQREATEEGRWFWSVHDAVAVLRRWSAWLPREHVHVVTVPPPGSPHDLLWRRFASLLGLDPAAADLDSGHGNRSLGPVETELLRRINLAVDVNMPMWRYEWGVITELAHQVLPRHATGERIALPADRADSAREHAQTLIKELDAADYDVVGGLDELRPARRTPGRARHPVDVSEAEQLKAAVAAIPALLDRVVGQRGELQRLRGAHAELDSAHEELRATHEELDSAHEELQATHEELDRTREELQATHKELDRAHREVAIAYNRPIWRHAAHRLGCGFPPLMRLLQYGVRLRDGRR